MTCNIYPSLCGDVEVTVTQVKEKVPVDLLSYDVAWSFTVCIWLSS